MSMLEMAEAYHKALDDVRICEDKIKVLRQQLSEANRSLGDSIKHEELIAYLTIYDSNSIYIKDKFKGPLYSYFMGEGPFPDPDLMGIPLKEFTDELR
jgi:hypothetical protein